jgi:hypothetical protein
MVQSNKKSNIYFILLNLQNLNQQNSFLTLFLKLEPKFIVALQNLHIPYQKYIIF